MSEFKKYQHIERFGKTEVNNINIGMCYIFPKIDGTNASLWCEKINPLNGNKQIKLLAGSRNRQLDIENDNAGFYKWAIEQKNIGEFFLEYPNLRLYGEWLVPHSLKTYNENAWRNFYVFDVMDGDDYLQYELYKDILDNFNIEYIPPICKIQNPTIERLNDQLEKNDYLIKDGLGVGEGIVIKNYKYVNRYGRQVWAKIVTSEFKVKHKKVMGVCELKEKLLVENEIVNKYITLSLVEKEYSKIKNSDGWESKFIPKLLNIVYYCLITEECWNFTKEFKNPTISFSMLKNLTTQKIKELKPELF